MPRLTLDAINAETFHDSDLVTMLSDVPLLPLERTILQTFTALVLVVFGFVAIAESSAAAMIAGVDGRLYFWGQDSFNAPTTDELTIQRTVVQGTYLAPGRSVVQVDASYNLWRGAIDTEGDIYLLGYWPTTSALPVLPSGAVRILRPANKRALSIATGLEAWMAVMSDGSVLAMARMLGDEMGCSGCGTPSTYWLPDGELVATLSTNGSYALAVTRSRKVYAIGAAPGGYGTSGSGDRFAAAVPVQFAPGIEIVQAATGSTASAALSTSGRLFVWGSGSRGELGNGSVGPVTIPVEITMPSGKAITAIAYSEQHAIAIDQDGNAFGWGANSWGQLGDETATDRAVPTPVSNPGRDQFVRAAVTDDSTYLTTSSDEIRTWGNDFSHHLASGRVSPIMRPTSRGPALPARPVQVVAGDGFSLARMPNGDVYARGGNGAGQLANGDPNRASHSQWVKTSITNATALAAASGQGLAIDTAGRLFSWGITYVPVQAATDLTERLLPPGVRAVDIAAGFGFAVALGDDGNVYTWGSNVNWGLGTGDASNRSTPTRITFPNDARIVSISSKWMSSFAVASDGRLFGWGYNFSGALGLDASEARAPQQILLPQGDLAKAVSAGTNMTLVLSLDGRIYFSGEISNRRVYSFTLLPVPGALPIRDILAGGSSVYLTSVSGRRFGAGRYPWGELTLTEPQFPGSDLIEYLPAAKYTQLSAGTLSALAITGDGEVVGWGENSAADVVGDFRANSSFVPDCAFDANGRCALGVSYEISVTSTGPGIVSPLSPPRAYVGGSIQFEARADDGYRASVSGCDATANRGIVTTGAVRAPCAVNVVFVPSCTLDLDGDGNVWPSTDGVLLLRAMLGVSESAFAVGVATLSTQDARHAAYRRYQVPAVANLLDFDGDGLVSSMTPLCQTSCRIPSKRIHRIGSTHNAAKYLLNRT